MVEDLRRCECGSMPVAVSMPGHPAMVALECPTCGMSTGYTYDRQQAYEHWQTGCVAQFTEALADLDREPVQLTISEELAQFKADLADTPRRMHMVMGAMHEAMAEAPNAMGRALADAFNTLRHPESW